MINNNKIIKNKIQFPLLKKITNFINKDWKTIHLKSIKPFLNGLLFLKVEFNNM